MEKQLDSAVMAQFTGTEHWYRHAMMRNILYTDGVKYVADRAGAYWLLDEIAFAQRFEPSLAGEEFQVWKLATHSDNSATLSVEDGNDNTLFVKEIEFTDFPGDGVTLWFTDNVILLPSEY